MRKDQNLEMAQSHYDRRDYRAAAGYYQRISEREMRQTALWNAAMCWLRAGDHAKSAAVLRDIMASYEPRFQYKAALSHVIESAVNVGGMLYMANIIRSLIRDGFDREATGSVLEYLFNKINMTSGGVRFVQVGANDGLTGNPLRNPVREYGWRGVMIEANPNTFKQLSEGYREFDVITVNACISNQTGVAPFYSLCGNILDENPFLSQLSSLSKASVVAGLNEIFPGISNPEKHINETTLPIHTLRDVVNKTGLRDFDVLVTDTEGHDYEVLLSADIKSTSLKMVVAEHKSMADDKKYAMYDMLSCHGFNIIELLGDIVCIRPGILDEADTGLIARMVEISRTSLSEATCIEILSATLQRMSPKEA